MLISANRITKSNSLFSLLKMTAPAIALCCCLFLAATRAQAATFTVTNTNDSGPGSLRQAIDDANATFGIADTIDFNLSNCPCTITSSFVFTIMGHLTIQGPGANQLAISGNNSTPVFFVQSGPVTLDGLTIRDGNAGSYSGGGIYSLGTLTISNSTISNNTAFGGGGILNFGASLTVINSTISNNSSAGGGGGIYSFVGYLFISNSTISNNTANDSGGGIAIDTGLIVKIANSTVTSNRADADGNNIGNGGGISTDLNETLNNTIVAGNFRGTGTAPDDILGTVNIANHNLIGDAATAGGIVNGVNGNIVGNGGAGTININTVLHTTLTNNGGTTLTHALVTGSPAVNAGSNVLAVDGGNNPLTTDQRGPGFPRLLEGTVDIGAFEGSIVLDSDDDGIPDESDPDTVGDVVITLPDTNFHSAGNKNAFLSRLEGIEQLIREGNRAQAVRELQNLRRRADGCGTTADNNDWITDCAAQLQVRTLIDMLITSLSN